MKDFGVRVLQWKSRAGVIFTKGDGSVGCGESSGREGAWEVGARGGV